MTPMPGRAAPRPQGQPGQEQVSAGLKALQEGTAANADSAQLLRSKVRPLLPGWGHRVCLCGARAGLSGPQPAWEGPRPIAPRLAHADPAWV